MEYFIISVFGLIIGSFINVCIYRVPRNESIVVPRSHCPKCGHILRWYENIPVLSYVFLLGRCRKCRKRISFIYPLVEILTAVIAVLLYAFLGATPKTAVFFILFASLIMVTFIDFERQEIPDIITLPGIVIGFALSVLYPEILSKDRLHAMLDSFLGILIGGGSLYIIGFLGELVFKKEAMGGGDIKLLAMIGAFLGMKFTLLTFFLAPFLGMFAGLLAKIKEGKDTIPYGPYISLAALLAVLWGDTILQFTYKYFLFKF
jgi:leader peptidase (prepilin peptidase) / N-methyltransferase